MKIEMHAHTGEASPCANVSAGQIPVLYQQTGYDAIVITDHYCKWAQERSGAETAEAYAQYFLNGYRTAKAAGDKIGFPVLLGAEANLPGSPNDYLLCQKEQILLLQAHPYRTYCTPADPAYLDGAESYNGNPRHNNQNELAKEWSQKYHMIQSSGSDFHELEDVAKGGIETSIPVTDTRALYQVLRSGNYKLLTS